MAGVVGRIEGGTIDARTIEGRNTQQGQMAGIRIDGGSRRQEFNSWQEQHRWK